MTGIVTPESPLTRREPFQDIIQAVVKIKDRDSLVLPTQSNQINKPGIITEGIVDDLLKEFTSRETVIWPSEAGKGEILSINRMPSESYTRGTSAHDVFFARALIRFKDQVNTVPIDVAIKTFDKKSHLKGNTLRDFINSVLVTRNGFTTFNPLCAISSNDMGFVLTVADPSVQSSDLDILNRDPYDPYVITRLQKIAQLLASLHLAGIFHGDAKIRNFAVTPNGNIEAIDWESAKILEFNHKENIDRIVKNAASDLSDLFFSVIKPVDRNYIPEGQFKNYFMRTIYDIYTDFFLIHSVDEEKELDILQAIKNASDQLLDEGMRNDDI